MAALENTIRFESKASSFVPRFLASFLGGLGILIVADSLSETRWVSIGFGSFLCFLGAYLWTRLPELFDRNP